MRDKLLLINSTSGSANTRIILVTRLAYLIQVLILMQPGQTHAAWATQTLISFIMKHSGEFYKW